MSEVKKKPELEQLPIHSLRSALKEKGVHFKSTDKKVDLIKMLRSGETAHKPREIKRAPILQDQKTEKSLPIVPLEIRDQLEQMAARGLKWEIDEESNCINFMMHIPTCANLDQSANNILSTAKAAFGGTLPVETGRPKGHPVEWV